MGNQEWTFERHWQHSSHKTHDEDKQNKKQDGQQEPHQNLVVNLRCSRSLSSSCFLSETRRITHIYCQDWQKSVIEENNLHKAQVHTIKEIQTK